MASSAIRISAFDPKGRERDRAFEFDSQDRAWLELDVVDFRHQHAAEHSTPDAAREAAEAAARPGRDYSAERAEPAADARVPRRAFSLIFSCYGALRDLRFFLTRRSSDQREHDGE